MAVLVVQFFTLGKTRILIKKTEISLGKFQFIPSVCWIFIGKINVNNLFSLGKTQKK
jgi:hypothetical protein